MFSNVVPIIGQRKRRAFLGCLPVSVVSAWNHVVSFAGVESFANGGFQSEEDGMNAAGKVLSQPVRAEAAGSCSRAASVSRTMAGRSKLPGG